MRAAPPHAFPPARRGFSLVELLVVIAVVGVLVGLLLPAVQASRDAARRTECANHLRQVALALVAASQDDASLPIGCEGCRSFSGRLTSWSTRLLPLLERQALADAYDLTLPAHHATNRAVAQVVAELLCPSDGSERLVDDSKRWAGCAFTDYGGVYGVEGPGRDAPLTAPQTLDPRSLGLLVYDEPVRLAEVTDGLAHTVVVAELLDRRTSECVWTNGHSLFAQEESTSVNAPSGLGGDLGSAHPGGAQAAWADGHVGWIADETPTAVLSALLTRAGEESER